jgi:hypothetical protein
MTMPTPIVPIDPNIDPKDIPRVSAQCQVILQMLQHGPQTSADLAKVALKYTSRISDLRKAGYNVRVSEKLRDGNRVYRLFPCEGPN